MEEKNINIKFCPEYKNNIKCVDMQPNGDNIYYCENCKNRFVIDTEF